MSVRSRLGTFAVGTALAAVLLGAAPFAQAASLTSDQIAAITNLLQSFNADAGAIANVQAVLSGTPVSGIAMGSTTPPMNGMRPPLPNGCAKILKTLKKGSSGDDVRQLQSFLGIATTTGVFGPKTEDALKEWQAEHGIAATGTPQTNGFGMLGPKTRGILNGELEGKCGKGDKKDGMATSTMMSGDMMKPPKPPKDGDHPMMPPPPPGMMASSTEHHN